MNYKLYNSDMADIIPTLTGNYFVIADPPYGVSENSGRRLHAYKDPEKSKGKIGWSNMAEATSYGDTHWDDTPLTTAQWELMKSISREQIVFGANHLQGVLGKAGSIIVWDKKLKNDWDDFFSDGELIWCSIVQPDKIYRQLWMGAVRQGEKVTRIHPTQKPVELMMWLINRYTTPQDTILDPFMGSGTTGIACQRLNRNFIGIESNKSYFDSAKARMEQTQPSLF